MLGRYACVSVLAAALVACSGSVAHTSATPSAAALVATLGAAGCSPPATFHGWQVSNGFPEAGLDSKSGSFWALVFNSVPPPPGKQIKIVWRMTGSGVFQFRVTDSEGKAVALDWGPDVHGSSNWNHPGDEAGTGITFTHAGCWDIHVTRTNAAGDLWLEVA